MNAFTFRDKAGSHAIVTTKSRVKRDGTSRTMCGRRIDETMQRLVPHHDPQKSVPYTCDRCSRAFVGFVDAVETDFGFEPGDRMRQGEKR